MTRNFLLTISSISAFASCKKNRHFALQHGKVDFDRPEPLKFGFCILQEKPSLYLAAWQFRFRSCLAPKIPFLRLPGEQDK
jgi:hypothetical protein